MKCERRKYRSEDKAFLDPRHIFLDTALESIDSLERLKHSFIETVTINGRPVAIFGLLIQWRGVATAWSVTDDRIEDAPKDFHKVVLEMIEEYTRVFHIWRLQFNVVANYRQGVKWAEALGFENEGLMRKFDPKGRDYYRFARVRNV